MSMTTIVFIVILVFFTWRGYQKGFVGAISRVLSFVIAYPAAIFFTKPFANVLRAYIGIDGLILFLIAGCTIFAAVSLAVTLLLNGVARLIPQNQLTETSSKIGGAAFGIIIGGLFGLIAVYVIDIFAKPTPSTTDLAKMQEHVEPSSNPRTTDEEAEIIKKYVIAEGAPVTDTFIDATAKKLVSTAASTAVELITSDKTTSQMTKVMTQDPQATLNHVQNITNNGELKHLLSKPEFQAELNRGNVDSLMQNQDFQQLMQNPDMQAIISSTDEEADTESAERATAEKMIQAWQKVATLKNDPRVLNIVSDPAFQAQLNSPNKLPLLLNPKMRELSEIIFSSDTGGAVMPAQQEQNGKMVPKPTTKNSNEHYVIEDITHGTQQASETEISAQTDEKVEEQQTKEEQSETKLYRWTDENGKVHFSDKPIKNKP